MYLKRNALPGIFLFAALLVLILDTKTAISGVQEGLVLCIATIIPSLFPFFVVSLMLTSFAGHFRLPFLCKLFGVPKGSEAILLIGMLGGYPAGAQAVFQSWKNGRLHTDDARKMLGFCCNAGPSFLFGIGSGLFSEPRKLWLLWGIHIAAAIACAWLIPKRNQASCLQIAGKGLRLSEALRQAVRSMADVCGWVILFRMIITFADRWFLWLLPAAPKALFIGLLELSNGCIGLNDVSGEGLRFVLFSLFLAFGGLCVGMQTVSVTKELGTGLYFPGKCMQAAISLVLSCGVLYLMMGDTLPISLPIMALLVCCGIKFVVLREKNSSFPKAVPV